MKILCILFIAFLIYFVSFSTIAQEKVDYKMTDKIRDKGFNRSQVMDIIGYMMDVYDRLVPEDLIQAAVILASFTYNAAGRDEMLPRTNNQMKNNRRWPK